MKAIFRGSNVYYFINFLPFLDRWLVKMASKEQRSPGRGISGRSSIPSPEVGNGEQARWRAVGILDTRRLAHNKSLREHGLFSAGQNVDCDQGSGEARPSTQCQLPAWAEVVSNPSSDRSLNRHSPKSNVYQTDCPPRPIYQAVPHSTVTYEP